MSVWDEMSGHIVSVSADDDQFKIKSGSSQLTLFQRLMNAVDNLECEELEELLKVLKGCDYIDAEEKARTQTDLLLIACKKDYYECSKLILNHLEIGQELLKIPEIQSSLNHALVSACRKGETLCVELLLMKQGADPDANDGYDNTPLIAASERGQTDVVNILLKSGCNVNRTDNATRTALHWAAMNGHVEIVEALLASGALPDKNDLLYRFTPLMLAARQGHAEVVKILLQHVSSFNNVDMHGETALFDAVRNNQVECVKLLLSANIDINHIDNNGRTPLLTAVLWNRSAMVKLLAKVNCRLDVPGKIGFIQTGATGFRTRVACRSELSSRMASPLEAAMLEGNLKICKMLVLAGCNKNVLFKYENSLNYLYSLLFNLGDETKHKVAAWLAGVNKNPRQLKDVARITIRKSLDADFMKGFTSLPIPKVLQEYLTFPELEGEEFED